MVIYRSLSDAVPISGSVVTMGTFDGLHRGHQEIVKQVVVNAKSKNVPSILITFDPHPRHVLDRDRDKLSLLMNLDAKISILKKYQVDTVLIIPFTKDFSQLPAKDFLEEVVINYFHPIHVIVGYDHHFGYKRGGSPEFIQSYLSDMEIQVDVVTPFTDEGVVISSSHIRELIQSGYIRRANFELGWVYGFRAKVIHGSGRGRRMTFPTANFVPIEKDQLLPENGVYLTRGRVNGNQLYGMCNLGFRPTFGESNFVMEVHFFDLDSADLYSKEITVEFLERIRDEKKFTSEKKLIEQLTRDKEHSLDLMKKYN